MFSGHKPLGQQTIVVTGASSGIGLATATMAAAAGARVVLVARSGDALAAVADEIEAGGGQGVTVVADVGVRADIERVVQVAETEFGGFDTWVNVAGQTIYGRLWEVSEADHEKLFQTNFWGIVHGSLAAVAHLRDKGGVLINVGSVASDLAFPMQGMYVASKHAVKGFTDALRMELLQEGIPVSVTLIKPTSIASPLPQRARNYMEHEPSLPPPAYQPEEVAHAILHAAVHPQRDIYVGGTGRALSALNRMAPSLFDLLAPVVTAFEQKTESPRDPEGTLHAPREAGEAHGDAPKFVRRHSFYTRATLNPLSPGALMSAGVSALSRVIAANRKAGS